MTLWNVVLYDRKISILVLIMCDFVGSSVSFATKTVTKSFVWQTKAKFIHNEKHNCNNDFVPPLA